MKLLHPCYPFALAAVLSVTSVLAEPARQPVIAPLLQPLVDHHALAGAVILVADRDRILDIEAVGYADIAAHKAMTEDALFWIASMSKPMTAAAFMILVDEGKASVDDPVEKYLNVNPKRGLITVFMVQNAGWREEGKQALPIFSRAAMEAFGSK